MHLTVYTSDFVGHPRHAAAALAAITASSKRRNSQLDISGVLFLHNGVFLQVLEGERLAVDALMRKIDRDPRHTNISVIIDQRIESRSFAKWNMDSFSLAQDTEINRDAIKQVSEVFKRNSALRSDLLVQFFKNIV